MIHFGLLFFWKFSLHTFFCQKYSLGKVWILSYFQLKLTNITKSLYFSVQTVSEGRISEPTTAEYRTVPLRPHNVTFDPEKIGPYSFTVRWDGPDGVSEFDRYTVAIGIRRKTPQTIGKIILNLTEGGVCFFNNFMSLTVTIFHNFFDFHSFMINKATNEPIIRKTNRTCSYQKETRIASIKK